MCGWPGFGQAFLLPENLLPENREETLNYDDASSGNRKVPVNRFCLAGSVKRHGFMNRPSR